MDLSKLLMEFEHNVVEMMGRQHYEETHKGCYENIPFDYNRFEQYLNAALEIHREKTNAAAKFLDVGCGLGGKLAIAKQLGCHTYGIEIDQEYAKWARKWCPRELFVQDALTFGSYDHFDIVYFYHPFRDGNLQAKLERRIIRQLSPGKVIISGLELRCTEPRNYGRTDRTANQHSKLIDGVRGYSYHVFIRNSNPAPTKNKQGQRFTEEVGQSVDSEALSAQTDNDCS